MLSPEITSFFLIDFMSKPVWMWLLFFALVVALLIFDLGVLHKDQHEIGIRESLCLSAFYITMGLLFGGWVWWEMGQKSGVEYITGFVVEKSLAMDNIFVIAMIFSFFGVPRKYQHRVLFWGILGVILLRAIMIGLGAALVAQFGWILYIFALFLVLTGFKLLVMSEAVQALVQMEKTGRIYRTLIIAAWLAVSALMAFAAHKDFTHAGIDMWIAGTIYVLLAGGAIMGIKTVDMTAGEEVDLKHNPLLKFLARNLRVTSEFHEQHFTVRQPHPKTGRPVTWATPLLLTLIMIEVADVIFAVDSVPAIFALTTDPYIVYTSNIFAILGLRALYFALSAMLDRFSYLKYALSAVLIFIGLKIFISNLMGWQKFPAEWSLLITLSLLASGFAFSLWKTRDKTA